MKIKRFTASDTRTAMQQIKSVFGPDAVILSSSKVDNGVEIVAAIDFDETILSPEAAVSTLGREIASNTTVSSPLDEMKQEIQTLRGMLEAQLRGNIGRQEPLHTILMQKLLYLGVSQLTASSLITPINPGLNQQNAWQQVLSRLSEALPICDSRRIEEGESMLS